MNADAFAFCGRCGHPLEVVACPGCATVASVGQAFCGSCGTPLGSGPPAGPAFEERKLATVLFADVVGFTSMAERTDPEVVARVVDAAFREMAKVVADHGGTVDKYMGDCLMAVFGVPVAHDDDAARAVAAGLAMSRLGGDLAFSIGINSGEVMATAVGGSGDVTVIGDTVNVAARLEKAAGPGQVLCGPLTAELAADRAVLVPRQALVLKGKVQPVPAWEATGLRIPVAGGVEPGTALIGRDDELEWLLRLWRRAATGDGAQVAVVCGDAGTGKTRLLDEVARTVAGECLVVRAGHQPFGATGGERLAGDVLTQLGVDGDPDMVAKVWSMAGRTEGSLVAIDPASLPEERLWAFVQLLERRSAEGPIVVLLDDLHHAHDTVLDFLAALTRRLTRLPVLLVLAGRSEPARWLANFSAATTIRLGALASGDAARLAQALATQALAAQGPAAQGPAAGAALDGGSLSVLVERSGGNPLHLRELVRLATTVGAFVAEGDHLRLELPAALPASLHALLGARLDALAPSRKSALQRVALLGPGATAALVDRLDPGVPTDAVADLVAGGVVRTLPGGCLEVVDPLLREVAYEALPQRVRAELHRRAATLMDGSDDRARHLGHASRYLPDDGELASEAAAALVVLGRELAAAWRLPEARRTLGRAVELGNRDPQVLLDLARLHDATRHPEDVSSTLSLLDEWPETLAIERDHTAARARIWTDPPGAREVLLDVAERWVAAGHDLKAAWAWANAGVASFNAGEMHGAGTSLERALSTFERLGDRSGAVAAESFLCLVHPEDPRVARWLVDTLDFADSTGDRGKQLSALITLTWHHFVRSLWGTEDEVEPVERFGARLVNLAVELDARPSEVQGRSLMALAARMTGRLEAASAQLAAIEAMATDAEAELSTAVRFAVASARDPTVAPGFDPPESKDPAVGVARAVVGTLLALGGRPAEALSWVGDPSAANPMHLATVAAALALTLLGRTDEARSCLDQAGASAERIGSPPLVRAVAGLRALLGSDDACGDGAGGDGAGGDRVGGDRAGSVTSVADALVLRAAARCGDADAQDRLRSVAERLALPGLLLGLE